MGTKLQIDKTANIIKQDFLNILSNNGSICVRVLYRNKDIYQRIRSFRHCFYPDIIGFDILHDKIVFSKIGEMR